MTVSTVVDHNDYTGNGVTTSFPYTFRIFKKADLAVSVVDLSDNISELVLDADYTVTNAGGYNGGNVVLTTPLENGWKISIARELEPTQDTDLRNQGKFFAEVHEDAFDKLTMLIQQVYSVFRLALRKPSSIANWYDALNNSIRNVRDPYKPQDAATKNYVDSTTSSAINHVIRVPESYILPLPVVEQRKNKIIGMDSQGQPIMLIPESGSAADVLLLLASDQGSDYVHFKTSPTAENRSLSEKLGDITSVTDCGADKTGTVDSTDAFISAAGGLVPEGTYIVNSNLSGLYYRDGAVTIKGNGTVKLVSKDTLSNQYNLPYDINYTHGGNIYPTAFSSFNANANANEYLRLPVLTKSPYGGQTYAAYAVLIGSKDDLGQNATQTSRIEIRSSTNNLTFGNPVIISTEGEQQASEPSIVFDKKRGRIWCFYATARGKVGIGSGSEGFDPNTTLQTWMTYSNTFGSGWSAPINITDKIKPANATSAWVPPSELCVTADGDIILPYGWYITSENMFYQGYIRISENSDGTLIYNRQLISRGGPDGSQGTGECQIVQLGDGSLFSMIRDYYNQAGNTKGRQRFYRSYDGVTWNLVSSIDTTNCKAGMGVFSLTASGYPRNAIMVTAPTGNDNSDLYRNNLKMWISGDYGVTWIEYPTTMFDDPIVSTGYSAVISLGNGAFMVLAEGSAYGVMNVKHRAIGAFTAGSTYARSYGMLPVVSSSELAALAANRDIPGYSLYWNNANHTLGVNVAGTAIRLSESSDGVDKGAITTLDADEASVFYMTATTTLRSITTAQNVNRVMLVVTQASNPLTLAEDSSVAIGNRIRTSRTISTAGAITLWRTKYGWYAAD